MYKFPDRYKKFLPYVLLAFLLVTAGLLRWHYSGVHSQRFFGLSFTDIANTHSRFLGSRDRLPYIDFQWEYPVILGLYYYVLGLFGAGSLDVFFLVNTFFSSTFALLSLWIMSKIHQQVSPSEFTKRAIIFWILSPSVFLFTIYNWDMLAVFLMLWSLYLLFKEKITLSFVVLCLGAFTKMFPGFLLLPYLIYVYKKYSLKAVVSNGLIFLGTSLIINLPLIIYNFSAWSYFFRFSSDRGAFGDNIWAFIFVLRDKFGYLANTNLVPIVSTLSLAFFAILYLFVNYQYFRSKKNVLLQTCFLSILAYLVTAKTTSAPFNLWILPFFVLLPINIWAGLVAELANTFVFYAFFQHIYYNDFLRLAVSPGHFFRLTYTGVIFRELSFLWAGGNYLGKLKWFSTKKLKVKN